VDFRPDWRSFARLRQRSSRLPISPFFSPSDHATLAIPKASLCSFAHLIVGAAAGVIGIYRYFEVQRMAEKEPATQPLFGVLCQRLVARIPLEYVDDAVVELFLKKYLNRVGSC